MASESLAWNYSDKWDDGEVSEGDAKGGSGKFVWMNNAHSHHGVVQKGTEMMKSFEVTVWTWVIILQPDYIHIEIYEKGQLEIRPTEHRSSYFSLDREKSMCHDHC